MKFEALGIRLVLGLILSAAVPASDAVAQSGPCVPLCAVSCIRPVSIPDRWDDATGIPGYMGEIVGTKRRPEWRNNQALNHENFTDLNANGLYDTGEPYIDGNTNGAYDQELYDPALTGYGADDAGADALVPGGDLGMEIVLHPDAGGAAPNPGQYMAVSLPPINKGTPASGSAAFRARWSECEGTLVGDGDRLKLESGILTGSLNQIWRDLIAQDPDASWDGTTKQVIGSAFANSPRVFLITASDPRIPFLSGQPNELVVRKVIAVFGVGMVGDAQLRARMLRVQATGTACGSPTLGGFAVECPVPATAASWGRIKGTYR